MDNQIDNQIDNQMDEVFICLGRIAKVYFYSHEVRADLSEKEIIRISGQIFNVMIHEDRINPDEYVCVYNITKDDKVIVVIIKYEGSIAATINEDQLKKLIKKIYVHRNEECYIIKFNGEYYLTYEVKLDLDFSDVIDRSSNFNYTLYNMETNKPMNSN
jgi:uncharacterized protein YqfB (UPF0267 family)